MLRRAYITVVGQLAAVSLLSYSGALAEARIWTSASGTFKMDAELVEARPNGTLILKKPDGQLLQVNVAKLSAADQQYVRGLSAGGAPLQHQPQPPDHATPARKLRPVPDAAAAAAKLKQVRELLEADYRQAANNPHGRQELYDKLMGLARESLAKDPTGAYVIASEACVVVAEGGGIERAATSIAWLSEQFEISDAFARKVDLVKKIKVDSLSADVLPDVAEDLLSLMDEAQDAADYERSMEIGRVAAQVARKSRDQALIAEIQARGRALMAQRETYQAVPAARKTLSESPQDKEANLCLGRFEALMRGKWDTGLPRLAAGSDAELAGLAKRDLARPAVAEEQLALADAWWTLSESPASAALPEVKRRAAYWYQQVAPQLTGLQKLRAEKRSAGVKLTRPDSRLPATDPVADTAGREVVTNSIGMTLKLIPAGEFLMGSPASEKGRQPYEGPQHRVRITQPFYMGIYLVTQSEFERVMGDNPSCFTAPGRQHRAVAGSDHRVVAGLDPNRFPVEQVTWTEIQEFCQRLSRSEHKTYRLPTEAEWEYACRAGTTTPFNFGETLNGDKANCNGKGPYGTSTQGPSVGRTTAVDSYPPNAFGLYDMNGNLLQYCSDWYSEKYYARSPAVNPKGPNTGTYRVVRGGGWPYDATGCRSANRSNGSPADRGRSVGFRVVREP